MGYDGNSINWSQPYTNMLLANIGIAIGSSTDGEGGVHINIPPIVLSKSSFFWGMEIRSHVNEYMEWWNSKSDFAWSRWNNAGRLADGPVKMIGGTGDPAGIFDVGAQVLSTWEPENRYLAMAVGIIGAVALKKPGLASAEVQAEKNLALGLGDDLFNFAEKNSFHTYRDFSTGFNKSKILDAMNTYDKIHFSTTGFGKIKFSKFDPSGPLTFKNYTNWEMHTIINDPALLKKTVFYNKAADGTYQILNSYSPFY